ncbi:TonB-dependent receptor [Tenacibaculum agarivorans]|uniref:TonB-dependent receptor n=1 Tax=Tenacibaculum agarivorans TaxID=1908389 RepID=UPI00094B9D09|nr:TonB-dependent receptor [Tenacibaculum agarivorans]
MLKLFKTLIFFLISIHVFPQLPTQTIRGKVSDQAIKSPLPYVNISLEGTTFGTTTDENGNFTIENIAIGRYDIKVSFIGYEPLTLKEIQVTSSKEVVLDIAMKESPTTLDTVIIHSKINKQQPLNQMATVSAKMLSIEEAKRFAGGFDDPARLVSSFAGVSSNVGNNAIVVRGNNPQALQWKLEGIEISNPNHFANLAAFGGGGLTALSTQLLANSDFFSGAMPAEYSNALSGVFDIFMRNGNSQKHEHTFQLGAIGIDLASEGPFLKKNDASYIFNYRYSTLGLLESLLPKNAEGTSYQDLSFKLNFPTEKAGTFSLWGMGLLDRSGSKAKEDNNLWQYDSDRENENVKQFMGVVGISHKLLLNHKQYLKTTLALTGNGIDMHTERLNNSFSSFFKNEIQNTNHNLVLNSFLNTKFNAKHTNKSGFVVTNMNHNIFLKEAISETSSPTIVDQKGNSTLISAYSNSMFHINNKIDLNIGLTGQWFTYNNTRSIEPRFGIRYNLSPTKTLNLAYGLHSRLERLNYYFIKDNFNQYINKNLDFSKAHHLVLGYNISISKLTHFKMEGYFQYLFDVPVIPNNSFSLINQQNDWFFNEKLQNLGKGKNYGLDISFEKHLSKGYYYMATASLFNSQYRGGDRIWRNTRYNRNIALNFLIGKEWVFGKRQNHNFGINARLSFQGGDHYSPINISQSIISQDVVFDETKAFTQQYAPAFTSHFTSSYRLNSKKTTHEVALKIINLTQYEEPLGFRYNFRTQMVDVESEATFIPNISYKVEF